MKFDSNSVLREEYSNLTNSAVIIVRIIENASLLTNNGNGILNVVTTL